MIYNKVVKLKNGKKTIIRNCTGDDAKEVYDNFNLTHGQSDFLTSYPDENSFNVEQEKEFLNKKEVSLYEIELCAIIDNKIVGTAGIEAIGFKDKLKHRCELGISIEKDYCGLGIGTELVKTCIECAKKVGYAQLELTVVADNISALNLYKKLGFIEFGRNPKGFYTREHRYQEIVLMRLELK